MLPRTLSGRGMADPAVTLLVEVVEDRGRAGALSGLVDGVMRVSRIFLSHSSRDNRAAIALRQWLAEINPPLANEIFLDLHARDGIQAGNRWKDALRQASARCEAVICLLSPDWEASTWCKVEYQFAEYLNKRVFCAAIAPLTGEDPTWEWQRVDLYGDGPVTEVDVDDGPPVRFLSEGLYRLREGIIGAGIGAETFVWPPPGDLDRAPYRGWEPLEEPDAAVFFGRDAQILRGLDGLRGMRKSGLATLFVVLGPSGTGKSSFLRAGLLPRLRRDDRDFVICDIVRPQRNVISGDTGMARAIYTTRVRLGLPTPSLGEITDACQSDAANVRELLREVQHAASARLLDRPNERPLPTLVLPLDQAEELLSADAGSEASQFLQLITDLTHHTAGDDGSGGLGLVVAVTIRTDRYQALQTAPQLAGVAAVVFDDLKPMPATHFREVITGPATRAGQGGRPLDVEPALINRLLEDATQGADTLPLLALTLARLFQYATDGRLTLAHYEAMGGMGRVVQREIDGLLATDPDQRATQLALLRAAFIPWLATINPDNDQPMRRLARYTDLPEASQPLIEAFVAKRLMVQDERDGVTVVEVALESLLRQWAELAGWLRDQRDDLKAADNLERDAAAWQAHHRDDAWLLVRTRLADAETLADRPGFRQRLAGTHDYLTASRHREDDAAPYGRHPLTGEPLSDKSKLVAGLLQLLGLLGVLGIGRIYLGYRSMGIAQLVIGVLTFFVGAVVWGIVDAVLLLSTDMVRDPAGRLLRRGGMEAYSDGANQRNWLATWSLIASLIGIPLSLLIIGLGFAGAGVMLGIIALRQIKQTQQAGRRTAMIGVVLGAAVLVIYPTYYFIVLAGPHR
jgi:hypothetical protein